MPESVIVSKLANLLVEDAAVNLPPMADALPGMDAVEGVLAAFRRAYGGLWVGGRATLTTADFSFTANAMNRAVQSGALDLRIPLSAISHVAVQGGFVTNIIVISTNASVVKARCFGAAAFADRIRAAAAAAR